ncbi:MAG: hypothetical protein R3D58_15355 [Saprospiraceae bacterium]
MIDISIVGAKTLKKYREYLKIYPSRRAAFRAAKRDANIPMSQHPEEVIYPQSSKGREYSLDDRNVRLYIFNLGIGAVAIEYHIREDKEAFYGDEEGKGNQPPHFNSGEPPKKLGNHHYWDND